MNSGEAEQAVILSSFKGRTFMLFVASVNNILVVTSRASFIDFLAVDNTTGHV